MKQILPPNDLITKVLGKQKLVKMPSRISKNVLCIPCVDGELWYHDLTNELLLFSKEDNIENYLSELIERWFYVPESFDEYTLAMQVRGLAEIMAPKIDAITKFTIFPTTDCNARCFYCYELGRQRLSMSDNVANDVATYIINKSHGNKIKLQWFGGEPLFNSNAIDIISEPLFESNIDFSSIMISNGFLFDENTVRRAVENWKLTFVQIPIDGREETYNKTKAFIYKGTNPYRKVLDNIDLLLNAGIQVSVRLNMTPSNYDELWQLSDELKERFGDKSGFSAYTVLIRDFNADAIRYGDEVEGLNRYNELQKKLINDGIGKRHYTRRDISVNQCMADNDSSITILPDGRIGKCEHESEKKLIGSIYMDSFDNKEIAAWKERINIPECKECLFAPSCIRLKQCDWHSQGCTEIDRLEMKMNLSQKVINTYVREKQKGGIL